MRRFSLRHLFLLTSFFCLWFGAYAYWRNPVVFAIPFYAAIAATMGYLVISNKAESIRIKRVAMLIVANIVYGISGAVLMLWLHMESQIRWFNEGALILSFFVFLLFILLQICFLGFHSFQLLVQSTRLKVTVLALLLSVLNVLSVYVLSGAIAGAYQFMR